MMRPALASLALVTAAAFATGCGSSQSSQSDAEKALAPFADVSPGTSAGGTELILTYDDGSRLIIHATFDNGNLAIEGCFDPYTYTSGAPGRSMDLHLLLDRC